MQDLLILVPLGFIISITIISIPIILVRKKQKQNSPQIVYNSRKETTQEAAFIHKTILEFHSNIVDILCSDQDSTVIHKYRHQVLLLKKMKLLYKLKFIMRSYLLFQLSISLENVKCPIMKQKYTLINYL